MIEILLAIFFITVLLLFLSTGIWVAISMIGVSSIGMILFTSRPVEMRWPQQFGAHRHHGH